MEYGEKAGMNLLIKLVVSVFLAVIFFEFVAKTTVNSKDLDIAALGDGTSVVWGEVDGERVHCEDYFDVAMCLDNHAKNIGKTNTFLWVGNSQLHAINQMSTADEPASVILAKRLKEESSYLLTMSQANANLQEHYVVLSYISHLIPLDVLILPVIFDDLRETNVRVGIKRLFNDIPRDGFQDEYLEELIGFYDAESSTKNATTDNSDDFTGLDGSTQLLVENIFNEILENSYTNWSQRGIIRGNLELALYRLRNFVFGVNASSERKIIPSRYNANLNALNKILELAETRGISVLIYIPPLRDDYPRPYNPREYSEFKQKIIAVASNGPAFFFDFEATVPNQYWGQKDATGQGKELELDFMHFQAKGHHSLANALYDGLNVVLQKRQTDDL